MKPEAELLKKFVGMIDELYRMREMSMSSRRDLTIQIHRRAKGDGKAYFFFTGEPVIFLAPC